MTHLATLYRSIVAGCICAVLVVSVGIADAALFFRGNLHQFFVVAVGFAIVGYLIQVVVIGGLTRLRSTHGTSQEATLVVLAAILFEIQASVTQDALLPTALMMIAISGISLGIALIACGTFKAGRYIRLMPFSMVAGFLAGSGLIMIGFSVSIFHGETLSFIDIFTGPSTAAMWKVLAGLVMGVIMIVASSMRWSEYTLPAVIVGAVVLFHLVIPALPYSFEDAVRLDWTMAREAVTVRYQAITPDMLEHVDWGAIAVSSPQLVSLVVVSVFATLIKISSLELMMRQRVDENREMRVAGYAGIVSGALAAPPGYHGISNSSILGRLQANGKIAALVTALITGAVVILAGDALILMPRFVFGAILLWVGFGMIQDSLLSNWGKVRLLESIVTVLIAVAVAVFGFMEGMAFGVLCGLVMFVAEYSRQETVRSFQSAQEVRSNVDRDAGSRRVLDDAGQSIWAVRLHSYLFFGSAARSVDQITRHLDSMKGQIIETLVLDFSRVTGIDSTALRAFQRLALRADSDGIEIWAAGVSPQVRQAFDKDGAGAVVQFFPTLDYALEAAENRILSRWPKQQSGAGQADPKAGDLALSALFWQHGMPLTLKAGSTLLEAGERPQGLFWVVSGVLDAEVTTPAGDLRVRRMGDGALIGEISWYLQQTTSARVGVIEEASLLHLNDEALRRLSVESPETTSTLHAEIARILSSRLLDNARQLRQLG